MTETITLPNGWIRPRYPAGANVQEAKFGRSGVVITGHLYDDCEDLLKWVLEPSEGAGWLDPRQPGACEDCIERYDADLWSELFHDEDCDCPPCEKRAKTTTKDSAI